MYSLYSNYKLAGNVLYDTASNELIFKTADPKKGASAELEQSFHADNSYHDYSVVLNVTVPNLDRIYQEIDDVSWLCACVQC